MESPGSRSSRTTATPPCAHWVLASSGAALGDQQHRQPGAARSGQRGGQPGDPGADDDDVGAGLPAGQQVPGSAVRGSFAAAALCRSRSSARRRRGPGRRSPGRRRPRRAAPAASVSSFSGVIIFMYLQDARSLTARKSTPGAALRSWWIMPISVATSTCRDVLTRAASTISPVDRIFTRSAGTAPAVARYSALVAQPHSGWMYRSASGLRLGLRGQLAAVDPGVHVALAAPDRDVVPAEDAADVRAEELVGAEQHRGVGGDRPDHLDGVGRGAADVGLAPSPRRWC